MASQQSLKRSINAEDFYIASQSKSKLIAFLLWLFLGYVGVHRYYCGRTKEFKLTLGLLLCLFVPALNLIVAPILAIWWIVDAFRISSLIDQYNDLMHAAITGELIQKKEPVIYLGMPTSVRIIILIVGLGLLIKFIENM